MKIIRSLYVFAAFTIALNLNPSFSATAFAGLIRTTISSLCTVKASGDLKLRFDIRNEGSLTARQMAATLNLADVTRRFPDLGNNPPDGKLTLKEEIERPGWKPGVYVGVLTISFEERNGDPHRAEHFFTLQYRTKSNPSDDAPLKFRADTLVFNLNAFWSKEEPLRVTLKNQGDTPITPELRLYLPEGYTSPGDIGKHPLSPGTESVVSLPVIRNKTAEPNKAFHLIASYEFNGLHYTAQLKEVIRLERKPVLFKVYVVGSIVAILLIWGVLAVRRKVTSDE